jgi:DNA-binding PadR family transcriptional regulator
MILTYMTRAAIHLGKRTMASTDPTGPLPPHTFHVLLVLNDGPAHGYGIKKEVQERTGGDIDLDAGGLYRMIARMEEQAWVEPAPAPESAEDARRKYYALTATGRRILAEEAARLTALAGRPEVVALAREGGTG